MGVFKTVIVSTIVLLLVSVSFGCEAKKNLKAFPDTVDGMTRHVIFLEKQSREKEKNFQVEVVAGKVVETDGVNEMRLDFRVESEPLKGWGYTYYVVKGSGMAMSTMMAPNPDQPKVEAFVAGAPQKIRYNSRLPIVVYAPIGVEVRYRIWEAPDEFQEVK